MTESDWFDAMLDRYFPKKQKCKRCGRITGCNQIIGPKEIAGAYCSKCAKIIMEDKK